MLDAYMQVVASFDNMGLKEELLRGLYGYGFEKVISCPGLLCIHAARVAYHTLRQWPVLVPWVLA